MPVRTYIVQGVDIYTGCEFSRRVRAFTADDAMAQARLQLAGHERITFVGPLEAGQETPEQNAADSSVGDGPPPMFTLTPTGEHRIPRRGDFFVSVDGGVCKIIDEPGSITHRMILRLDRCDGAPL